MEARDLFSRLLRERARIPEDPGWPPEVRVAVYDSSLAAPQVISISAEDFTELVGETTARTYALCRERGSTLPYVVIREIVENLIHAYFQDAVITILDNGTVLRVSDHGPGIRDKEMAFQPGFSTATREMKQFIRGVGSGLPVAREQLSFLGGSIAIDDNLGKGTVVTLTLRGPQASPAAQTPKVAEEVRRRAEMTTRQKKILLLIAELGSAGPSTIARELATSHSTAYRELHLLERLGLVKNKRSGKRTLTEEGITLLGEVFKP
ncbi:MAG: helix-turn-helix domain-containing protein [Armatimonadetes bacterium]|nr:helix-turn-helix domain-containing protein [Armatimonadota bacterium]